MSNSITNKVFCIAPFVQTVVRANGNINPCCLVHSFKYRDVKSYWNSPELQNMRSQMLSGQTLVPQCNECYIQEKNFGVSMRTEFLRDYQMSSDNYADIIQNRGYSDFEFPRRLEVHLGNLCNLKCLTCKPQDSSSFLVEDKILKISNFSNDSFQLNETLIEQIIKESLVHGLDILDLRGGESMLMPRIKQLLTELPEHHKIKTLRIQTNGTILDDAWKNIFLKFEQVEIMISIDAYGDANHYIRYPSQWADIERTVDYVLSLPHAKKYVHTTVSNLNFLLLDQLIDWCRKKEIYFHSSPLLQPSEFCYTNLPKEIFNIGCNKLKNYPEVHNLLDHNPDTVHWNKFCSIITKRDNHRKNSIFDILPELKPFWI